MGMGTNTGTGTGKGLDVSNLMAGKKVLVMGLRNRWSLAWGITRRLQEAGATLAFTYQGEREREGVEELARAAGGGPVLPCDMGRDEDIDRVFAALADAWGGRMDGLVHAVAHAFSEDIQNDFLYTSRAGFAHALDISAYSLIYVARKASELMGEGGSIVTLTYLGSSRVYPGYNVMGVAKAALESTVRYLAQSLGGKGVRVNAVSSGPIKTISSKAVKDFSNILGVVGERAPLRRGVGQDEVGGAALYLLSPLSSAVTGEVHFVDCGFNVMGV